MFYNAGKRAVNMRPEVITIQNVTDCKLWEQVLKKDLQSQARVGNIFHWVGSKPMPLCVFDQFDFLILSDLPKDAWEEGGIVRPRNSFKKLPLYVKGRKHGITFFAGWETRATLPPLIQRPPSLASPLATALSPFPRPPTPRPRTTPTVFTVFPFPPELYEEKMGVCKFYFPHPGGGGLVDYPDSTDEDDQKSDDDNDPYAGMPSLVSIKDSPF